MFARNRPFYFTSDIYFAPIITPKVFETLLKKDNFRSLKIGIANSRIQNINDKNSYFGLFKSLGEYKPASIDLHLSMGRKRKGPGLAKEAVLKLINSYINDSDVRKLEIKVLEENGGVQPYDLIKDRVHHKITIPYTREDVLTYDKIVAKSLPIYLEKRPELKKMLFK